jgi:hypothetical protein
VSVNRSVVLVCSVCKLHADVVIAAADISADYTTERGATAEIKHHLCAVVKAFVYTAILNSCKTS